MYAHKHVYIHILIKLDIIQIKVSLTLLTVSFFQYLTIKKMATASCSLYIFTDCTSQRNPFTELLLPVILHPSPSDSPHYLPPLYLCYAFLWAFTIGSTDMASHVGRYLEQ